MHLEFLYGVDRRQHAVLVDGQIIVVHSVEKEIVSCSRAPFTLMEPPCVEFCEPSEGNCAPGTSKVNARKLRSFNGS